MQENQSSVNNNKGWDASRASGSNFIALTTDGQTPPRADRLDLAAVRERLKDQNGPQYWRSLEQLADTPGFQELIEREFPRQAPRDWQPLSRRDFLKYMGAALALAGVSGCALQPQEHIVPYVAMPEEMVPDKPLYFATAYTHSGFATGLLAENNMGRPTKLEGNPDHPASLGATGHFAQAAVLGLYDPERSASPSKITEDATWATFVDELRERATKSRAVGGDGLRVLTETTTSPTMASQMGELKKLYPKMRWHQYEAAGGHSARAGAQLAFGADVQTVYNFESADVVLALDADFLSEEPGHVRYARDFMSRRRAKAENKDGKSGEMNRLYAIESTPTLTGAKADHRLPVAPNVIESVARFLAEDAPAPAGIDAKWLAAMVQDLQSAPGRTVVIAGQYQTPTVHALVHRINAKYGNIGKTVQYTAPIEVEPADQFASLRNLVGDMNAGRVQTLLILGGNPAYDAPADIPFAATLEKMSKDASKFTAHLSLYNDETSNISQWHLNQAHFLEAWSDARAYDGTTTIIQPLIQPIYNGKSIHEFLAALLGKFDATGYGIVRGYWQTKGWGQGQAFEAKWRKALNDGVIANTKEPRITPTLRGGVLPSTGAVGGAAMQVVFRPDPMIYDGRFSNNGWLQELPKPFSRLTWDNAAIFSPTTAEAQGLINGDMVQLSLGGRQVDAPIYIVPGQPDNVVTAHLGYGRERAGKIGNGMGFNAYKLRTSTEPYFASGLAIKKLGRNYPMATTENHHMLNVGKKANGEKVVDDTFGRGVIRAGTIEEFRANPQFIREMEFEGPQPKPADAVAKGGESTAPHGNEGEHGGEEHQSDVEEKYNKQKSYLGLGDVHPSLFPYDDQIVPLPEGYVPYSWGMTIDLTSCIGCSACTVACQSENNIATVGKDQVLVGREMHWIRIDTYFRGDVDNPETHFQPLTCMHCEKAPCEPVCPVEATAHSVEGLNEMTYNRCVGTRYCSNNCPYKVRRFNFLQYSAKGRTHRR